MIALQSSYSLATHPCVRFRLISSKIFKVIDLIDSAEQNCARSTASYTVVFDKNIHLDEHVADDNTSNELSCYCAQRSFVTNMRRHGFCILYDSIPNSIRFEASKLISNFSRSLIAQYDLQDDCFVDIDIDHWNITRMPRIGRGKHNIHFDPFDSDQHMILSQLASQSLFAELLSKYMGKACSLRECGLSLTRPRIGDPKACSDDGDGGVDGSSLDMGEGMEWHSDGSNGEATVLMSFEDIDPEQGALRVIPNSHKVYIDGIGHDEETLKEKHALLEAELVRYPYRAAYPIVIDARTLHSVDPNCSNRWRQVVWFIFDSY